jgi:hypothetical protein
VGRPAGKRLLGRPSLRLVGRPAGKRLLGRPSRRWMILKWMSKKWDGGLDWIYLAQYSDRLWAVVNAALNLRVPYNGGNLLNS